MKCQLCNVTEFDVLFNVDHPIEKQPVIICKSCARGLQAAAWNRIWLDDETKRQTEKGKRCE